MSLFFFLFLLAFIILILMHFYLHSTLSSPFHFCIFLPPHSTSLFYQLWFFPSLSSHSVLKFILVSISNTFCCILFFPPTFVFSFSVLRPEKQGTGAIGMRFCLSYIYVFFLFAVLYMILVLFICCMLLSWFLLAQHLGVCTFVSWGLKQKNKNMFMNVCICVCVCIYVCMYT